MDPFFEIMKFCPLCGRMRPKEDFKKVVNNVEMFSKTCKRHKRKKDYFSFYENKKIPKEDYSSLFWGENKKKISFSQEKIFKREIETEHFFGKWIKKKIIPVKPQCEICGKRLYWASGVVSLSPCFDHKVDKLPIRKSPTTWLKHHKPTEENTALWLSCNFGILCSRCNSTLPTKKRKQWLFRVKSYVFGRKED